MTQPGPPSVSMSAVVRGTFVGPVPGVASPQAVFESACTDWEAYDVPQLWHSVSDEDSADAWAQVNGWKALSEVLADQHDRLLHLRGELALAWKSPAADAFLQVVDGLLKALREDAYAHMSTAIGLHGVLEALKRAKDRMAPLKTDWDNVTTDWLPEWWDGAAADLNERARSVMVDMEAEVRDHRTKITIPRAFDLNLIKFDYDEDSGKAESSSGNNSRHGVHHTSSKDIGGTPPHSQPRLGPVLSQSPTSVLPIPPGNPYLPGGGLYALPNNGSASGWLVPMNGQPFPMSSMTNGSAVNTRMSPLTTGMMPMAMGGAGRGGIANNHRGRADVTWETREGVPQLIGSVTPPEPAEDAAFSAWLDEASNVWSDEGMQIRFHRRTDENP